MDNSLTQSNQPSFDAIRQMDNNGREYWSARDLHDTLGYSTWQKFQKAINRAMKSYKNAGGINVDDHFNQSVKMVSLGSGAERKVEDFHLSRRACYLIAMNADPDMPSVALAQAYFYTKTRESELKVSQGTQLDFWTLAQNPQIRRQKIEMNEDVMLSLRKETECLKYIEQRCNPELSRRRGRRNTPRVVTTESPVQTTQLMLSFGQDIA